MSEPETYFYSCPQGHRWPATSGLPIRPGADRVRCPQCDGAVTVLRAPAGREDGSAPSPPPGPRPRPTGSPPLTMCPGSHVASATDRSSPPGRFASAGSCRAPSAVSSSGLRRPAARRRRRHPTVRSRFRSPPRGVRPSRLPAHPRRECLSPRPAPPTKRAAARRRSHPRRHPTGPPYPNRPRWRATRSWAS